MWNESAPMELLNNMPTVLEEENVAQIQSVIDVDKYKNSMECGYDLCGQYAPFCRECDKGLMYPCPHAYVKMKQAEGMDISVCGEEQKPKKLRIAIAKRK